MIQEIKSHIDGLKIIDTHEHLPVFEDRRQKNDIISEILTHYLSVDLVCAGLSRDDLKRVTSADMDVRDKWKLIEKSWERARFTGYSRAIKISLKELYGIEDLNGDNIVKVNDLYLKTLAGGQYKKVLKDKCNIEVSINDAIDCWDNLECDKDYFILSSRLNAMIFPETGKDLVSLEKVTDITISSFDNYLTACEKRMEQYASVSKIIKLSTSYSRTLDFTRVTRSEAEAAFNKLFYSGYCIDKEDMTLTCEPAFTNYVLHYLLGIAQEKGMVIQIHTGIQEGNGNVLQNSNPTLLNTLFLEYPKLKFDLFHIGYPFYGEIGALCKMFPNVYADMCWSHIISPVAARNALSEWLELMPYNKICGFGGDYLLVDGVYGHLQIAKENIASVLSQKVESGLFSPDDAFKVAKAILYDNPKEIFEL